MANDTVAVLDKLLDYMIEPITEAVVAPDDRAILKLFAGIPKDRVYGRGLKAYFPMRVSPAGGFGVMAEEGEFPVPKATVDAEANLGVIKHGLSFAFTDEAMKAMQGGRKKLHTTVGEIISGGMKTHKARQEYFAYGRGDGSIARASSNNATSVTQFTCSTPIRAVEGDQVIWFARRAASGAIAATAAYVTKIDHENGTFDVSTSPSVTILANYVAYLKGSTTAGTIGTDYTYGMEAHLDRQTGSTVTWDSDDSATKQNVETYAGLGRSTNAKMCCGLYDAGTAAALTLTNYQVLPAMSIAQGAKDTDLVMLMHFKMFRRFAELFAGAMEIKMLDVQLPLGKQKLPVITGAGFYQLPVIQSYYIPDGFMACIDKTTFRRLAIPGEWAVQGGSRLLLMPGTTEYTDVRHSYYKSYENTICTKPFVNTVGKDYTVS